MMMYDQRALYSSRSCLDCTIYDDFLNESSISTSASTALSSPASGATMRDDYHILLYALPVIVFAGTIGNGLSVAVLLRPSMRFTSVYFYLLILAFADTLVLYVSAFKTWIRLLTDFEMLHYSNASCKTLIFVLLFSMTLSAWLIVFMAVDRFVAVWFPFSAASVCNVSRARLATVILFGVTFVLYCHVFWTMSLQPMNQEHLSRLYCRPTRSASMFMVGPFEYLKLIFYNLVPFVIILSLNIAIIVRLRSSTRVILQMTENSRFGRVPPNSARPGSRHQSILRHMRDPYSQTRITSMLLAVSFAWLFLTLPFTLNGIITVLVPRPNMIVKAVCFILMYTNHAINFGLYCLTGKKFRRELVEVLGRVVRRRRRAVPHPSPSVKTQRSSHIIELDIALSERVKHCSEMDYKRTRSELSRDLA